jgi:hypothetical protein
VNKRWSRILGLAVALGVLLGLAGVLRADLIFLEDGRVIDGRIVQETDDEVLIETVAGVTVRVEPWEVKRVATKDEILEEYKEKLAEIDESDADALYKLAQWCQKHGLKDEYEAEFRATLKLKPDHPEAKNELDLLEGRIELPEQLTQEEKEELRKKAEERKKAREEEEAEKKKKEDDKKSYPFGTVTREQRAAGDLDCKGDCHKLVQGGYMKFDLGGYEKGATVRSAQLKVYVKSTSKNPWLWACLLRLDPTSAPVADVFAAIQSHSEIVSGAQKIQPGNWQTLRLSPKAVQAINEALARDKERWVAIALTFE